MARMQILREVAVDQSIAKQNAELKKQNAELKVSQLQVLQRRKRLESPLEVAIYFATSFLGARSLMICYIFQFCKISECFLAVFPF